MLITLPSHTLRLRDVLLSIGIRPHAPLPRCRIPTAPSINAWVSRPSRSRPPFLKISTTFWRKPRPNVGRTCWITYFKRRLAKDECLHMFRNMEILTTSALAGVYKWAADLSTSRFKFDFDFNRVDINLLDAYD